MNDARRELSDREFQTLKLACDGLTDQAIANRLGISLATVGTYWGRIRTKMGPHSRTELVANYLRSQSADAMSSLKAENVRMAHQLDSLYRQETQVHATLQLFMSIMETAPDAIIVVDHEGDVRLANDQACRLFGHPMEALVGLHLRHLVPPRFHGLHNQHRQEYMAHPERRRMGEHNGTTAIRADGTEFPIAATLSAFETTEGELVTCIVRDLSSAA